MAAVAEPAAAIFAAAGAKDRLHCISVSGEHRFYTDETWRAIEDLFGHTEA